MIFHSNGLPSSHPAQVAKPQSVREEFRQLRRQATQKAADEANAAALEDPEPGEAEGYPTMKNGDFFGTSH